MIEDGNNMPVFCLVDDEDVNLARLTRALSKEVAQINTFHDGREALDWIAAGNTPDLVLSDVMMPRMDGFSLCNAIKSDERTRTVQVILVTGLDDVEDKVRGLEAGADDFLTKPFHPAELRARVRSQMRVHRLHAELDIKNRLLAGEKVHLEEMVRSRTVELEELTIGIVAALEKANAMKDVDTGLHIKRVCLYTEVLASRLGMDRAATDKVRRYSSLHDVGKVGIPDSILKKEGPLTPGEREEMKLHTLYGFELLGLARADPMARMIALFHHERWDGAGYPKGMAGESIPFEARIVALGDVYDALTTPRCYKRALSAADAECLVRDESGRHFDPRVAEAMLEARDEFHAIREGYRG